MAIFLRRAAKEDSEPAQPSSPPFMEYEPHPNLQNLIGPARATYIELTRIAIEYAGLTADLNLRSDLDTHSNATRRGPIRLADAPRATVLRISNLGPQRNTARAFAWPIRPASSGMESYRRVCDYIGRPPSPAPSDTIVLRVGPLRPVKTWGILPPCYESSNPAYRLTECNTSDTRSVSKGLVVPRMCLSSSQIIFRRRTYCAYSGRPNFRLVLGRKPFPTTSPPYAHH